MKTDYIKKILNAPVYDAAIETPIDKAEILSQRLNNRVLIKREDLPKSMLPFIFLLCSICGIIAVMLKVLKIRTDLRFHTIQNYTDNITVYLLHL